MNAQPEMKTKAEASRHPLRPANGPKVKHAGWLPWRRFHCSRLSGSPSAGTAKRLYDLFFTFCGLLLLSPLFAVIAVLIKLTDGGPIFYRQERVGRAGRKFLICKFRTMVCGADQAGPAVTRDGDARITGIGRLLRKAKLDELPQLWNVLKGEMSLVGPRPEVPRYVEHYTPAQRAILRHKPGITDLASLYFRDEEALLANAGNLEEFYLQHCVPRKLRLNEEYAQRANLFSDTWVILQTICPYWFGVLLCYAAILAMAFWLSYKLIYDFAPLDYSALKFWPGLGATLFLQLGCLTWRQQCHGLLSYFSCAELRHIGGALSVAGFLLLGWSVVRNAHPAPNVVLVNVLVAWCLLSIFRGLLRWFRERGEGTLHQPGDLPTRVGIIGTDSTGAHLALELKDHPQRGRIVVAFFDDDFHKWQKRIHGVPVAGMPECLLDGWADKLDEVVIALPSLPTDRVRQIEQLLRKTRLKYYTVSSPACFWGRPLAA